MSSLNITEEQSEIINNQGNVVVLAKPGSGKTFTIASKISEIVKNELLDYEGIIAISYTNKASDELKSRVLKNGINKKGSFFNTLDTFLLMEIIYPFGTHVFGKVVDEFKIYDRKDTSDEEVNKIRVQYEESLNLNSILDGIKSLYVTGKILLELVGELAIYIYDNSYACRRYLKSKYKYVFIDEYQDCGQAQHDIFLRLVGIGVIGVAVGDSDQSIYGFSGKSSKYLLELASDDRFNVFYLNKNFRCHKSIVDYSLKLLNKDYILRDDNQNNTECRMFYRKIQGTRKEIVKYIDTKLNAIKEHFNITNNNEIGVLVRDKTTGSIVNEELKVKHKYFINTPLDENTSLWGAIFKKLLIFLLNNGNAYELAEEYFEVEDTQFAIFYEALTELKKQFDDNNDIVNNCIDVAKIVYPNGENLESVNLLQSVVSTPKSLNSYKNANNDEIQIMTLHKSKGLEFAIVFHLDLYKYIMPQERLQNGVWEYIDYTQCLNLHYVGITRAKTACFLMSSTKRLNGEGVLKNGIESKFLNINGLDKIRNNSLIRELDEAAADKE